MKYLIISDIHEDLFTYQKIINRHTDIDYIIICGDTVLPRKYYQNDKTLVVAGNCDFDSSLPLEIFTNIFEKKALIVHGHTLAVKHNLHHLHEYAKSQQVDIVFYGHTHEFHHEYLDHILYINPGSLKYNQTYIIIDAQGVTTWKV